MLDEIFLPTLHKGRENTHSMIFSTLCTYYTSQIKASTSPVPGIPGAFDTFSCLGGREFDELSPPGGRAFDHHSQRVGNLIASLDFMLRVTLIPCGLINYGREGRDKL